MVLLVWCVCGAAAAVAGVDVCGDVVAVDVVGGGWCCVFGVGTGVASGGVVVGGVLDDVGGGGGGGVAGGCCLWWCWLVSAVVVLCGAVVGVAGVGVGGCGRGGADVVGGGDGVG